MIDLFGIDLVWSITSSIATIIFSYSIFFIQCAARKRNENHLTASRREGTTNVVAIGGGHGGAMTKEQDSNRMSDNKEKSSVQNSKFGTPKSKSKIKTLKSPHQQQPKNAETPRNAGSDAETGGGGGKGQPGKKSDDKTKQTEGGAGNKRTKYGDTINDDTLNDTDCDWGAGEVVYKADRSKKKKKRKH